MQPAFDNFGIVRGKRAGCRIPVLGFCENDPVEEGRVRNNLKTRTALFLGSDSLRLHPVWQLERRLSLRHELTSAIRAQNIPESCFEVDH